jgi:hypothetical protein
MSTPPAGFGSTVAAGIIGTDADYREISQSIALFSLRKFSEHST